MSSKNTGPAEGFDYLGYYSPSDAEKLIQAFDRANIVYRVEIIDHTADAATPLGHCGGLYSASTQVLLSASTARRDEIQHIHESIFGDCLPNFDSSFFATHPRDQSERA
jgi:hypothetical protein